MRWLQNLEHSTALLAAPKRCVHVGDRESDIYELYCKARELSAHFGVRTCVDRLAGDGEHTIADEMDEVAVKGLHAIEARDEHGEVCRATLELKLPRASVSCRRSVSRNSIRNSISPSSTRLSVARRRDASRSNGN